MNASETFHNQSMDLAEQALLAKFRHAHDEAKTLFLESLEYELKAIDKMRDNPVEPTFSILHQSAATLAMDCKDMELAEKLLLSAVGGDSVPVAIREELHDLLKKVRERCHSISPGFTDHQRRCVKNQGRLAKPSSM